MPRDGLTTGPTGALAPVVLVAHGSRDPRAQAETRALARAVACARPGLDVRVAFLELAEPRPADVLAALRAAGAPAPVVVPLLLTRAYHGRVDLPAQVAGFDCAIADTLGAVSEPLLAGLVRRLHEAVPAASVAGRAGAGYDAVVLAAAGTSVASGRAMVDEVAAELGRRLGVPCQAAYASAAAPTGGQAVTALREAGAQRVAVASYFLAPGRLYEAIVADARDTGAIGAAAPLGASRELVRLVLHRVDAAAPQRALVAA
ncbi:sirohydrochlorin chelatase [Catellatospora bangladeshensis]|uniref:Cobalamin biosynthesis protein n=1 Tax=Catellatospora bangladeshensis TaxID=310355 RepID=A0A8J3JFT2_9ACTN|nr:CbiX/SirB N-terminal domain-containing protein [Catellatospora bangladeshensis]GIF79846.1 cobalamin biosynthesis protein [Catellatospora bangladeshensis]